MKKAGKKRKRLTAEEFDARHDAGVDLSDNVDWSRGRFVNQEIRRVNVDFPQWMIDQMDQEAKRLGVTRQSIIKVWIADRLESLPKKIA